MAETPSAMISIGTPMPEISLPDARGEAWKCSENKAGYLVMFMCNHCPFVVHVARTLNEIASQCKAIDIEMVGINSNDAVAYPADAPDNMTEIASTYGWTFPYLVDETQDVARAFRATCTPDVFLYDADKHLYYRGQLDDSRPGSTFPSDGQDVLESMQRLLADKDPPEDQKPSIGCNIKWKS
jgi:peroxiredoxin